MADSGSIFLAAIVGAGAALVTDTIKGIASKYFDDRAQAQGMRIDDLNELCAVVHDISELSVSYWQRPGDADGHKVAEARISGKFSFVFMIAYDLFDDHAEQKKAVNLEIDRFFEACTGGDFGVRTRPAMPERSSDIVRHAYGLARQAKRATRKTRR